MEKSCKDFQTLKTKKRSKQRKLRATQRDLKIMKNTIRWYGHVVRMDANRLPKRIIWSPKNRRQQGRPEAK